MGAPGEPPGELANSMLGALMTHLRDQGGERLVRAVLESAGERRPLSELEDGSRWGPYAQALRLFSVAAELSGEADLGRRVGELVLLRYASSGVLEVLRSLGSPSAVLRVIGEVAAKQSTVTTMSCVKVGDRHGVVAARTTTVERNRLFCDYTAGALSAIPVIFGMHKGVVAETRCQTRGDPYCRYEVEWDPSTADDLAHQVELLRTQVMAATARFEALEAMASELASVDDVDDALERIVQRARMAAFAPQFVLAVRLPRDSRVRVHHVGLDDIKLPRVVAEVLGNPPDDHDGSRLIVDVASARHSYGRLAALYPRGYRLLPQEPRLLSAYAGHVAAILDTAAALDEARKRAATIESLLDLATGLSELRTATEVAFRLSETTREVVGCQDSCVLVFEPQDAVFVRSCRATRGHSIPRNADASVPDRIVVSRSLMERMTQDPTPIVPDSLKSNQEFFELARVVGFSPGAIVPIAAAGALLGMIVLDSGDWEDGSLHTETNRGRSILQGIAKIAATALENARMFDEIRHQASHDPLTDLPNARLFEELVEKALANAARTQGSVALLFVDLDYFKRVNDEFGHRAGDRVLVEAGHRLRASARAGDSVARIGGDEFAILMPGALGKDIEAPVRRILERLSEPISVANTTVVISASIGAAIAEVGRDDFDSLLRRADGALYRAKSQGRARVCLAR